MEIIGGIQTYRSLAEVFSNANIKRVVDKNDFSKIKYRLKKYIPNSVGNSYGETLKFLYNELYKYYRVEIFYKNQLFHQKLKDEYAFKNTVCFTEFSIKKSIADFILINGELKVFEIKTEWDDLTKLEKQISDYHAFADKIFVVAHGSHFEELHERYDASNIGLIELSENGELKTIKEAGKLNNFDRIAQFKTLRKPEYTKLIKDYYGEVPKVPNMYYFKECLNLVQKVPSKDFHSLYLNILKERIFRNEFNENLNIDILQSISYDLQLNQKKNLRLEKFLKKSIS